MSRSKKDGRRGGAHQNTQGKELWSRRASAANVNMWEPGREAKTITHRAERRQGKAEIRATTAKVHP